MSKHAFLLESMTNKLYPGSRSIFTCLQNVILAFKAVCSINYDVTLFSVLLFLLFTFKRNSFGDPLLCKFYTVLHIPGLKKLPLYLETSGQDMGIFQLKQAPLGEGCVIIHRGHCWNPELRGVILTRKAEDREAEQKNEGKSTI